MGITKAYIFSQIFTIAMYLVLAISYHIKKRKNILILTFVSHIFCGVSYILLNAYTGVAMCIVAMIRDAIFMVDENKNGKRDTITKKDVIYLIIFYLLIIISTTITYQGLYSLLSAMATMTFTYSVWQKKPRVYKMLGIPTGILWIVYNFCVKSIFGVILETILLIASISGFLRDNNTTNNKKEITDDINKSSIS